MLGYIVGCAESEYVMHFVGGSRVITLLELVQRHVFSAGQLLSTADALVLMSPAHWLDQRSASRRANSKSNSKMARVTDCRVGIAESNRVGDGEDEGECDGSFLNCVNGEVEGFAVGYVEGATVTA